MSPEHMRGESTDARADLFSLGVVLFEAAAGVRPFDGAHDVETMQKILDGDRLSLEDVAPDVPAPLREVIERLIEVNPDARTTSAAQLIEELAVVAPPPEVRRELASTVEGHCGGPSARMHVRARQEERDTELSRPPAPVQMTAQHAEPQRPAPRKRGRAVMLAGALLALLVTAVAGSQWLERSTVSVPASVPAPASVPVPASASVPGSVPVSVLVAPVQGSEALRGELGERVLGAVRRALAARGYLEVASPELLGQAVVACQTPECVEQVLDAAGAAALRAHLEAAGIDVRTGERVERIEVEDGRRVLHLAGGARLAA
ncbi:MAG: protein kinase, partial [Deltaproteobacteria bacterium]